MKNRVFVAFVTVVFLIGALLGYLLSCNPLIRPYKLLFVIGSIYNLMAVVVLSELFVTTKRHKEISVNYVAPAVLWTHTQIALGATIGALAGKFIFKAPGGEMAVGFSSAVFAYSIIPLGLFDSIVVFPRTKKFTDLETRWKYFGLFMVTSGVLLQLVASIIDVRY